jgi:sodium-dependent dicarboxylate transporter 2/3/5
MEQSTLAIVIVVITVILMVTEKIPLATTVLLSALAMSIFGIQDLSKAYSYFGSTTVVFLVSMMIIGNGLFETGVAQDIGNFLFKTKLVKNERIMLVSIVMIVGIISGFTSNSAITAMMIPLVGSVALKTKNNPDSSRIYQKNILMAVGVAAAVGGQMTLSGSTSQLVAQGILEAAEGVSVMTYFEMTKIGLPLIIITAIYFGTIGYSIQKKVFNFEDVISENTQDEVAITKEQVFVPWKKRLCAIVTILCLLGFITETWNIGFVAMVGATILLVTRCLDLRKSMREVDWNTVLILGAAQSMANGLDVSGGGLKIANFILNMVGGEAASPFIIMAIMVILTVVLTNIMSNTATTAMFTPIAISIAAAMNIDPLSIVVPMVIASGCAVATPIGTPCMTQVLVGGYSFKHYLKVGTPLAIILTIATIVLASIIYGI